MKKIFIPMLVFATLLIFTSCGKPIEGEDLILKARKAYTALDSATIEIVNVDTDQVEQRFTFMYDEKDMLIYSYSGTFEDEKYLEYNNGYTSYTNDDGKVTQYKKGDKKFISYTRKSTHPTAGVGLVLFEKKAVKDASVTQTNEGTTVTHIYDIDKLKNLETDVGDITDFTVIYYFDKEDNLLNIIEKSVVNTGTKDIIRAYSVEIGSKNEITAIEKPEEME